MIDPSFRFPGRVHHVEGSTLFGSRGTLLIRSDDKGVSWNPVVRLPFPLFQQAKTAGKLMRRLFRAQVHHLIPRSPDEWIVVAAREIFRVDPLRKSADRIASVVGSRPLRVHADSSGIYYGEYRSNPDRSAVSIWWSETGDRWQPVYTMTGVRHIHGVFRDPWTNAFWVTTGDLDSESGIWRTDDLFSSLDPVVTGTQQVRAIELLFTEKFIYFGTDTPLEESAIYRMSRDRGNVQRLHDVDNPVGYGTQLDGVLLFSTFCEPSEIHTSRSVSIIASLDGETFMDIFRLRKDWLPFALFQFGHATFPTYREGNQDLWINPVATEHDQTSLRFDLDRVRYAIAGDAKSPR